LKNFGEVLTFNQMSGTDYNTHY